MTAKAYNAITHRDIRVKKQLVMFILYPNSPQHSTKLGSSTLHTSVKFRNISINKTAGKKLNRKTPD